MLATGGDDGQVLVWDLSPKNFSPRTKNRSADAKQRRSVLADPVLAYSAPSEIGNVIWSPVIPPFQLASGFTSAGEWVAATSGKTLRCLRA
ncbi:hypothetical protein FRC17_008322 [Serendipita sp. 399]|nr:hypothetical protein FRC17_008322 [Serendipita sp. 399]